MKKISWNKSEICALFDLVEHYKNINKPLLSAFQIHSESYKRKRESVRNFYYAFLKRLENDANLQKSYNININNHKKTCQKFFSPEEERASINNVKSLLQKGYSVRKACYEITGGNAKEMLRLQNKFRNCARSVNNSQKTQNASVNDKKSTSGAKNNIYVMPQRNKILSDEDINSLFLGLVKLVKNNAAESAQTDFRNKIDNANNELRMLVKRLAERERQIELLQKNITLVARKNDQLEETIKVMRSNVICKEKSDKVERLKNYINSIATSSEVNS